MGDDVISDSDTAIQSVRDLLGLAGEQIEPVDYEVEFHDLDGAEHHDWRVRRFYLSEGLSECYETTLELLNPNAMANSDALLGQAISLHITRASAIERMVHGIVRRVDYIGITADNLMVRVHVVPALRLLEHRVTCRIFQAQSIPEILEKVIGDGLGAFEHEFDMRDGLTPDERDKHYPKRDYCVQYNESDLAFVSRLMEEEGISYFFEHDPAEGDRKKELLVLVDQRGDSPNAGCPETPLIDPDGAGEVPIIPDRSDTADTESIQAFDWSLIKKTLKTQLRGFNWKAPDPEAPCEGMAELQDESAPAAGIEEFYVYGEHHKTVDADEDDDFNGTGIAEDADAAVRCLELYKRQTKEGSGRSNVVNLSPGYWFKLREHAHDGVNELAEFLITRVIHSGDCPDVERQRTGASEDMLPRYENKFVCIPRETKFRPAKTTRRPRIYGPQTATVTGPGSEEIHTDKHGRIKVKFHWDRESKVDDTTSCWVRVAQAWSGPGWGSLFIPRVGMEVVVEFLNGDPDDPLVTGCVYNANNRLPYGLPDERTKSTIKTNSSPGSNGFNELRFEDAAGSEEVFLHAEKDYNEVVKNDHTTRVGANQTHTVGGDRVRIVKGSETITIEGNQTITINGVCQDKGTDGGCGVTGKQVKVHDTYDLETTSKILFMAPDLLKLTVGGSTITMTPGEIVLEAGGKAKVVLNSVIHGKATDEGELLMDANVMAKSAGKAQVQLDGGKATVRSSDGSTVVLDANVAVEASTGAKANLTADATVSGGTVVAKGSGGNEMTIASAGITLGGAKVDIKGSGGVEIEGAGAKGSFKGMVKLN
jgi:type VI secretion system secreted protein VgrG